MTTRQMRFIKMDFALMLITVAVVPPNIPEGRTIPLYASMYGPFAMAMAITGLVADYRMAKGDSRGASLALVSAVLAVWVTIIRSIAMWYAWSHRAPAQFGTSMISAPSSVFPLLAWMTTIVAYNCAYVVAVRSAYPDAKLPSIAEFRERLKSTIASAIGQTPSSFLISSLELTLWLTLLYPVWILPIGLGIAEARRKGISPRWVWISIVPLYGWLVYAVLWRVKCHRHSE